MARRGNLLLLGLAMVAWTLAPSFVGGVGATGRDESLLARNSKEIRAQGNARRGKMQRENVHLVEIEGKMMPKAFEIALGAEEEDTPFDVRQVGAGETKVTFEKKPYGILRWQPGKGFKGAMVKSIAKPVFVGDPQGQAAELGVKSGMVVKSINGEDVMSQDFDLIMKKLGDEALAPSKYVKVPLDVVFAS
mmetsp:Transcript_54081/g.66304  ORF Transcript_54081/g.66304 Transcript_54081/m.66304 type:complete len:191 (-) Transcript_54081:51-623(-)